MCFNHINLKIRKSCPLEISHISECTDRTQVSSDLVWVKVKVSGTRSEQSINLLGGCQHSVSLLYFLHLQQRVLSMYIWCYHMQVPSLYYARALYLNQESTESIAIDGFSHWFSRHCGRLLQRAHAQFVGGACIEFVWMSAVAWHDFRTCVYRNFRRHRRGRSHLSNCKYILSLALFNTEAP